MPERECLSCGTELPSEAAFCLKCGTPVSGSNTVESEDPLLNALENAAGAQYEVIRLLGRGGMGAVYLARERALDRLVAIKVLPPDLTDAENIERFRREAKTAAKLNHPNIVPLHTFGEADGMMYFVMGFVQGESLGTRLARRGRLDPDEVRLILAELAAALHCAHERGVVHRDIKPDNILIDDETGKPMLADFGVAKSVASGETLTQLGTALGTPYYMSPEQAAGDKDVDGRSDLYSLGIVGYQLLSGRLPYEGDSIREVLVQHVTREATPLKTLDPDLPDDLVDVISSCLVKDRENRVSDGQVLSRALNVVSDFEGRVPEEMQELVTNLRSVPVGVAGAMYLSYGFGTWGHWVGAAGFAAIAGLIGLAGADLPRRCKAEGLDWNTVRSHGLKKPTWWSTWWPKRYRAMSDMWDRLPREIKQARSIGPIGVAGIALAFPAFLRAGLGAPSLFWLQTVMPTVILGLGIPIGVGYGWIAYRISRLAKRLGLKRSEVWRLVNSNESAPIWKKPQYEKVLLPPSSGPEPSKQSVPATPAGFVDALLDLSRQLAGPSRAIGEEAMVAARDLLHSIEMLDQQISSLARDSEPNELAQLEKKVAALGKAPEDESEARRRMRVLLEEQLSLAHSLAHQLESAQERRAHLVDLLKTLWMQIANLRAHYDDDRFDSSDISGRIRAISDDAKNFIDASDETTRLLKE